LLLLWAAWASALPGLTVRRLVISERSSLPPISATLTPDCGDSGFCAARLNHTSVSLLLMLLLLLLLLLLLTKSSLAWRLM
jgi:hypothetical protein